MALARYSKELADQMEACVLIPTYNNAGTLAEVISRSQSFITGIIVVNDGSTDDTAKVLDSFTGITVIHLPHNKGKGNALKQGLEKAETLGYHYVITMDSDGQHFPEDIPYLLSGLDKTSDTIIIGSRNMYQSSVPVKSSFGNRFSNFWFRLYTGISLPDTQSGYRVYPIGVNKIKLFSTKYELEVEILVSAAWRGMNVKPVPIRVYYPPGELRVSHFRPFRDFTRISVLNTILFFRAFFYEIPKRYILHLIRTPFRTSLKRAFDDPKVSPVRKASAIGFGVFMGIFPVWGYQLIIGWALCQVFKLNKVLFTVAAHISIPPMIPFIIFASYKVGALVVRNPMRLVFDKQLLTIESIKNNLIQYIVGAILLSIVAGLVAFIISRILYSVTHKRRKSV